MIYDETKLIHRINAFTENSIYGRTVVENGEAYLYTDDEKILLKENDNIKVVNGREYFQVNYHDLINVMSTDGWPLFAGKDAIVKIA